MWAYGFRTVTMLAILAIGAPLLGCGGDSEESTPPVDVATGEPTQGGTEASRAIEISLTGLNDSAQTGIATFTTDGALSVIVEVAAQDIAQYALIARGACDDLVEPFADIPGTGAQSVTGGTTDGRFGSERIIAYADAAPVTLEMLGDGVFSVVIVDALYRGGGTDIPDEVAVLPAPDPEGPFGERPFPLAACGTIDVA